MLNLIMLIIFIVLILLLLLFIIRKYFWYNSNKTLKTGMKAPDFSLKNQDGNIVRLSDFKGKKLAIYFYPKDDTPGCTIQATSIRDLYDLFRQNGIEVLGISYDLPESHKRFKEKYNLPFMLLSDENKQVAQLYGASTQMGNIVSKRITFLIDENGNIIKTLENFDINLHAQQILDAFK